MGVGGDVTAAATAPRPATTTPRSAAASNETFVLLVLCGLLLCSGAAGLIYQVVWVRLLSLAFGVTVFSVSTVLAAFMGGLAIGSMVGGRLADRLSRPLVAYGLVELGIGLTALATPMVFGWLQSLYRDLALLVDPGQAPLVAGAVRGVLVFAMLLVPTALMGASLPLAVRGVRRAGKADSDADVKRDTRAMGVLYALNTTGAILGTLAAGFVLIGTVGIGQTVAFAAALNVAAGLGALALAFASSSRNNARRPVPAAQPPTSKQASKLARAAFWGFGISGAVSLAYEIVWSRVLAILFNSTIYGFVLMLATVLFGIAVGSAVGGAIVTRMPRARFAGLVFGWLEIGIGTAAILSIATFGVALDVLRQVETTQFGATLLFGEIRLMTGLCVLTVLPASLLMGATFPFAARLWAAGDGRLGARLGGVYAANVAGGILGSLIAGFLLIPLVGAHTALLTLATVNIAVGVWLLWATGGAARVRSTAVPAFLGVVLVAWGASQQPMHTQAFRQHYPEQELLWYHEGLENTVSIARRADGVRTLFTNSRGQSNDEHDLVSFYRTIGHLPTLLAPRPSRALVVGMGSGVTSSAIAEHPNVQVQIVELSDGMMAAAPHFAATNRDLVNLSNVKINMDDGRNFLLRQRGKFDIVVADVIHPYDAGSNNLYALGYFRLVAQALSPNGVVLQWVSPEAEFEHKLITRTFLEAFPYVTLWGNGDLLIGSLNPLRVDQAELARRLADPAVRSSLQGLNLSTVDEVLGRFRADSAELRAYVGDGPVLTDEVPIFEYFYSRRIPTPPPDIDGFSRDRRKVLVTQ